MNSEKSINTLLFVFCLVLFCFVLVSSKVIDQYEEKQNKLEQTTQSNDVTF